ncbi:hypothetical protein DCS65_09265 [Bacillus subtilis]|nr:hypothetical protein DCS65_09265 [Bacillus subtilis]
MTSHRAASASSGFLMKRSIGLVKNIQILGRSKIVMNEIEIIVTFLPVRKRKNLIIIEIDYFRWGNNHEKKSYYYYLS